LGHKYWGGKNLGKIYFSDNILKKILLFSKFFNDLFLVIDNFFMSEASAIPRIEKLRAINSPGD